MLSVFENVGFVPTRTLDGGVVEVRFPIEATEGYRARVDERDHVAVTASLRPFFEPRTVAVIGASARRGSIGGELFRNVLAGGFTGAAYPVNRSGEPVAGVRAYRVARGDRRSDRPLRDLPSGRARARRRRGGAPHRDPRALRDLGRLRRDRARGRRAPGAAARRSCARTARGSSARTASASRPRPSASTRPSRRAPSRPAGSASRRSRARSGSRCSSGPRRADSASPRFVSIGNKADVSSNDLLEWWEDDPGTDLVLLYVESFGNPRKFARIARRLAREKPVLAMKSGRSRAGQKAAGSHTAALAGSDTAVDAVFRQAGVIRADTLGGLLDVAALLSCQPVPRGRRVAVLTNAGGLGILCADACEIAGLELPQLGEETRTALAAGAPVRGIDREPRRHARLGDRRELPRRAAAGPRRPRHRRRDRAVRSAGRRRRRRRRRGDQRRHRRGEPARQARAGGDSRRGAALPRRCAPPPRSRRSPTPRQPRRHSAARPTTASGCVARPAPCPELADIDTAAAAEVVADGARGRTTTPGSTRRDAHACSSPTASRSSTSASRPTPDEAAAAATELGYPVVVKTAEAGAHKTESGGVALDLADAEAVRAAAERIGGPVIVQPQIKRRRRAARGRRAGSGVRAARRLRPGRRDGRADRRRPLPAHAAHGCRRGRARRVGQGGKARRRIPRRPAADAAALADILHRLSRLADDFPELAELDLNPVIGLPDRAVVVDARIRVARPRAPHRRQELVAIASAELPPGAGAAAARPRAAGHRTRVDRRRRRPLAARRGEPGGYRLGRRRNRRARAARASRRHARCCVATSASTRSLSSRSSGRSRSASSSPPRSSR